MANTDFARGLWPVGHLCGGQINTHPYTLTAGQIIRKGEVLIAIEAGTVEDAAGADGIIAVGVSADYIDDTDTTHTLYGKRVVNAFDDPNIIFGVQAATGTTPAVTGNFATSDLTACSSTSQVSNTELVYTGGNGQVKIIGKIEEVNNAWGEHCDMLVIFNEHLYKKEQSAVGTV